MTPGSYLWVSEFRAAVDPDRVAGDPAGLVGGEEGDDSADVVRLGDTLQGLNDQREVAAHIRLGKAGHIRFDDAGCDGVDADAASAECRSEVRHQRIEGALGSRIGRKCADGLAGELHRSACGKRGDEHDTAALAHDGQQLLHQEVRRADIDGEEGVEVLDRGVLDACRLRDARIGHQDVQAGPDDALNQLGQRVRAVRRPQIDGHLFGTAAGPTNLGDDRLSLLLAAGIVNEDLRPGLRQRECAGAADAARGAGAGSRRSRQPTALPPSTETTWPVMNEAEAEATKTIARAISSGLPNRPSGTVDTSAALFWGLPVKRSSMPVSVGPGATALTRTPEAAPSSAADLVMPSTACLLPT